MSTTTLMPDDRRSLMLRLSFMQYFIAVLFAALAISFWIFQIAHYEKFREMARENHLRRLPLPAPRGVLLDRNGVVLVQNQNTFNIALVREQTKDLEQTLHALSRATGADEAEMREIVNRRRRDPSYRPIVLIENATVEQVIAAWTRRLRAPRHHLSGSAHAPVSSQRDGGAPVRVCQRGHRSAAQAGRLQGRRVRGDHRAGRRRAGLQPAADGDRGQQGRDRQQPWPGDRRSQNPELRSQGRAAPAADDRRRRAARRGRRLQALRLQRRRRLPRSAQRRGARARQRAGLRPQHLRDRHRPRDLDLAQRDKLKPMSNRALQGIYSPGPPSRSPWRPPRSRKGSSRRTSASIAPAARASTDGTSSAGSPAGTAAIDMRHAMEQSCNVYYYTLGNMLGVDRIHKWASALGLGERSGIELPNELKGLVPSTQWKRDVKGEKWYAGETISVAIGQGQVSVTPLSMAVMMMTVANGGTRYTPHVLKAVDEGQGWTAVPAPAPKSVVKMKPETVSARSRRPLAGRQRGRHRRPRADRGEGRVGQDRDRAGNLADRRQDGARQDGRPPPRLVRVFCAPGQPADRRRGVRRARGARIERRADREVRDGNLLREARGAADAVTERSPRDRPGGGGRRSRDRPGPRARAACRRRPGEAGTPRCSNDACSSTSTGSCSAPCCCSAASA